jgi:hypothetical protein
LARIIGGDLFEAVKGLAAGGKRIGIACARFGAEPRGICNAGVVGESGNGFIEKFAIVSSLKGGEETFRVTLVRFKIRGELFNG